MSDRKTSKALDGVVGALRERSPAAPEVQAPSISSRVRRPEARFGVDDLMELSNDELLRVVTELEPTDLVLIAGSRGAGELAERIFALLPESVARALIDALKAQGRPNNDEAQAALLRAAEIVTAG